jgi:hypothetical protein
LAEQAAGIATLEEEFRQVKGLLDRNDSNSFAPPISWEWSSPSSRKYRVAPLLSGKRAKG